MARIVPLVVAATLVLSGLAAAQTQTSVDAPATEPTPPVSERTIEDLNLVGAAVTMPPLSDSVLGDSSRFRRGWASRGLLLRLNVVERYSQNVLNAPVPGGQQVYIGHRPTLISGVNTVLTADLRQLGLRQAQLNVGVGWRYASWKPAGPDSLTVTSLYFYKGWRDRRVEMKAGYIGNDLEFVGLQVGGSLATGAQGVYAVLPSEVGLSFLPLVAPSFNVKVRLTPRTYIKSAVQRSLDAAGAQSTEARNPTGLTFAPAGNRALVIGEAGYQRPSSQTAGQVWVRGGYMRNGTAYLNRATGEQEAGNYCAYALADLQVARPDMAAPGRGVFVGATAMTVPDEMNAYNRYYEGRVYQRGLTGARPHDVLTVIASYRDHSPYFTDRVTDAGGTTWRRSISLTSTYTLRVSRGDYLSLGLGFVRGGALTPRVKDALIATASWSLFL